MKSTLVCLLSLALLATSVSPAAGQEPTTPAPQSGDWLDVYLITAGPGDAIWERFSHNAIRIVDRRAGTDLAYNWGIFDFRQESFIKNLAQGRMLYAMYGIEWGRMAASYIAVDRALYQHPIHLSGTEKIELQAALRGMDNDSARFYRYDYYRDNCSTRVRDALDAILGGAIADRWSGQTTQTTYRWHTRRLTWPAAWAYFGIQFVVGNPGDEPISAYEEMFLPLKLMEYLEQTEIAREGGATPLLGARERLHASSRAPVPAAPPQMFIPFLVLGIAVAGALTALARSGAGGIPAARWGFTILGGLWGLVFGLLGTGLLLAWAFTDHVFWHWNENAFSINPLLLLIAGALVLGAGAGRWSAASRLTTVLAGLTLLGLVLQVLPGFDQVNGEIAALIVPVNLALWWGARRLETAGHGEGTTAR